MKYETALGTSGYFSAQTFNAAPLPKIVKREDRDSAMRGLLVAVPISLVMWAPIIALLSRFF